MCHHMLVMTQVWKSKPEVEYHRGGALFTETGGSNISAMDREMYPEIGSQVDFNLTVTKNEIRCEIAMSRLPSWKIDATS